MENVGIFHSVIFQAFSGKTVKNCDLPLDKFDLPQNFWPPPILVKGRSVRQGSVAFCRGHLIAGFDGSHWKCLASSRSTTAQFDFDGKPYFLVAAMNLKQKYWVSQERYQARVCSTMISFLIHLSFSLPNYSAK
jgi:hypothetical protein